MLETVIKVIAEQLSIEESKITPQSSLVDDLKADSLNVAAAGAVAFWELRAR